MNARKLDFIDALRGYAILAVVIVHVSQTDSLKLPEIWVNFFAHGARGVQLFFMVSAFTLFYSFDNRIGNEKKPISNFFIRRFFRIAPMYYLAITYYVLLFGFDKDKNVWSILSNIFFIHGFTPYWINSVVPGGWSIGVEMFFYLILPFLFLKIIKNIKQGYLFFLFSILFKALLLFIFNWLHLIEDETVAQNFYLLYFPSQLPFFALGIIMYFALIKKESISMALDERLLIFSGILTVLYLSFGLFYYNNPDILFGIAFLLFGIGISKQRSILFVNKIINYVGKISFSMYIVHFAVLDILTRHCILYYINFDLSILNFFIRLVLVLILTIIVSGICYKLIEIPFQNIGKKIIKKF